MHVRIMPVAANTKSWYNTHIGKTFQVVDETDSFWMVEFKHTPANGGGKVKRPVYKRDAQVVGVDDDTVELDLNMVNALMLVALDIGDDTWYSQLQDLAWLMHAWEDAKGIIKKAEEDGMPDDDPVQYSMLYLRTEKARESYVHAVQVFQKRMYAENGEQPS